jgi:hypothetical protein
VSTGLKKKLEDHLLTILVTVIIATATVTSGLMFVIVVGPRDFEIERLDVRVAALENQVTTLQKEVERYEVRVNRLKNEIVQRDRQITDAARTIEHTDIAKDALVIEFPWVDTDAAPGHTVAAAPYLHAVGVSIRALKPQDSELVLVNNRAIYRGAAVKPTTSQNFLTLINTGNAPCSFTLEFSQPCKEVTFTRPALYAATESGITHPAWSAHALNKDGREVSSHMEDITRRFDDVPARKISLESPGLDDISAVRFDSDPRLGGKPFTAFGAILIERLTLVRKED